MADDQLSILNQERRRLARPSKSLSPAQISRNIGKFFRYFREGDCPSNGDAGNSFKKVLF